MSDKTKQLIDIVKCMGKAIIATTNTVEKLTQKLNLTLKIEMRRKMATGLECMVASNF